MAYTACPAPTSQEPQQTARHTFSTITITRRLHHIPGLINTLADRYARFVAVRRQRRTLLSLTDAQLLDIGLTRADAEEEYRRSFNLL
ncbi:DUF1127 domain-containing protein [Thalassospira sp.]|uniref:DUF1127 domain-containing protein n=1 Tax=Thalassospira sp. TaxID=1912094 RepID=UPI00311F3564